MEREAGLDLEQLPIGLLERIYRIRSWKKLKRHKELSEQKKWTAVTFHDSKRIMFHFKE